MLPTSTYQDLKNREWDLSRLDDDESRLLAEFRQLAQRCNWHEFENHWTASVAAFYQARGMARQGIFRTPLYHLAQDLSNRLAVASGVVGMPRDSDLLRGAVVEPSSAS